jgi:hypothetical protein
VTKIKTFTQLLTSNKLKPLIRCYEQYDINWLLTQQWMNQHHDNTEVTSATHSRIAGFKIKSFSHTLPTLATKAQYFPQIYNPHTDKNCRHCNSHQDNNSNLFFCPLLRDDLNRQILSLKEWFITSLSSHQLSRNKHNIIEYTNRRKLFQVFSDQDSPTDHPIYLLLHNAIPAQLVELVKIFINNTNEAKAFVLKFMIHAYISIIKPLWNSYTKDLKSWEKSKNIHKRLINHRRRRSKRRDTNRPLPNNTHSNDAIISRQLQMPSQTATATDTVPFTFLKPDLYLILASSNFLHGGPWLEFLDTNVYDNFLNIEIDSLEYRNFFIFSSFMGFSDSFFSRFSFGLLMGMN